MNYFKNISSYENLKTEYRRLARIHHPDMSGDTEAMKVINNEYDQLFIIWKHRENINSAETAASTRSEFYTQNGWKGENYNSRLSVKGVAQLVREVVEKAKEYGYTIVADTDTRDNSEIYVVKFVGRLDKDEFSAVAEKIKEIGGYYSKFKHGFIFKAEPSAAELDNALNKAEQKTTKKEAVNAHGVKVGDIYYTSWGFEQTNIDFYEVVAVTEKMATVKPIKSKTTETHFLQGKAEPVMGAYITDCYGKSVIKTKTYNDGEPTLNNADGREHMGHLYDGRAKNWSSYA